MTEKRQPWAKFYWADWRSDVPLRTCGYAARGLWADLLSLMAESAHFGCLLVNGRPPSAKQLVGLLGGSEREIKALTAELGDAGVYSQVGALKDSPTAIPDDVAPHLPDGLPAGTIISRRMIRDKVKAERDKENGKKGGNPTVKPQPQSPDTRVKPAANEGVNPPVKAQRPEARDQKPEDPRPRETNATRDTVAVVVETFERLRRQFWPHESALTSPGTTLRTQAEGYLDGGATPALCAEVFERVMLEKIAHQESAPSNLHFCRKSMESAVTALRKAKRPLQTGPAPASQPARPDAAKQHAAVARQFEERFGSPAAGPTPGVRPEQTTQAKPAGASDDLDLGPFAGAVERLAARAKASGGEPA